MSNNNLTYKENKKKGVLGTLEGVCADCIRATRNGRRYDDAVWEHAFSDPVVKEQFSCGGIFGQLGHPNEEQSENEEFQNIAICMPEPPVKGPDGKLRGRWDILDTPNGRILKCLCDYGYKIGISSRGNGDIVTDFNGNESVDPDTFEFKAFDAVLLPAVKEARLNLVTESINSKDKTLKKALKESIDNSNDVDKAVMLKTLSDLGIDYNDSADNEDNDNFAADNDGADLVTNLQNALREINDLKAQLFEINERLSVSNTKEIRLKNQVMKLQEKLKLQKDALKKLNGMKHQVMSMKEQLENSIQEQQRQKKLAESYKDKFTKEKQQKVNIVESNNTNDKIVESLRKKIQSLQQNELDIQNSNKNLVESLNKTIDELKHDSLIKNNQYKDSLKESNNLVKKYQVIAKNAINSYIDCKSNALGISSDDIKSRLKDSFSIKEIDSICESLKGYNLNINKLPFQVNKIKNISMKEDIQQRAINNPDDIVDKSLLDLI